MNGAVLSHDGVLICSCSVVFKCPGMGSVGIPLFGAGTVISGAQKWAQKYRHGVSQVYSTYEWGQWDPWWPEIAELVGHNVANPRGITQIRKPHITNKDVHHDTDSK